MTNVLHFTKNWNYLTWKKNVLNIERDNSCNGNCGTQTPPSDQRPKRCDIECPSHWRQAVAFGKQFAILMLGSNKEVRLIEVVILDESLSKKQRMQKKAWKYDKPEQGRGYWWHFWLYLVFHCHPRASCWYSAKGLVSSSVTSCIIVI